MADETPDRDTDRAPEAPSATPPDTAASAAPAPKKEPEHALSEVARARRRRLAKAVLGLTVLIVLVLFVVWNAQPVEVNFVFAKAHPRMIWVMVACAVLGGMLGYLLGRPGDEAKPKKTKST